MMDAGCAVPWPATSAGVPLAAVRVPELLHRQQLLRLSGRGWAQVLEAQWDASARRCLTLWAARSLPLVVTRQPQDLAGFIATGLPAPARMGRRRIALTVAPADVLFFDEFPPAEQVTRLLPAAAREAWRNLLCRLADADCNARVYGGYGWQRLTGLAYLHAGSDVDLLLAVRAADCADAVCQALATAAIDAPRLDGELLLPDGAAVAWREWLAWRAGRASGVLVKRLRGVALETPDTGVATESA